MRGVPLLAVLVGCAAQPRTARPYQDGTVAVAVAAGTGSVVAGVATAAVVTVAVGTVVVGAEQFPDPPAGTPQTTSPPAHPPDWCGSCSCFGKGLRADIGSYHYEDGAGAAEHTRRTCWQDCKKANPRHTGYKCTGDKAVTWVE
jgi:hypothetical protein